MNLKFSRIVLQREDDSWPENPWRVGDTGKILFTGAYNGGGEKGDLCTSSEQTVGDELFKSNSQNPDYPLYRFNNVNTLAHELVHYFGKGHNPVYMLDIQAGKERLSY